MSIMIHLDPLLEREVINHLPASVYDELRNLPVFLYGSRSMLLREKLDKMSVNINRGMTGLGDRDYDFIMQDTGTIRAELAKRKFKELDINNLYAPASQLASLYIRNIPIGGNDAQVQVMLMKDFYLCRRAWMSIDPPYWYKYLWKSSPQFVMKHLDKKGKREYLTDQFEQIWRTTQEALK